MKVFTYYDSSPSAPANQAELIRVWAASWRSQGWTPRLLTIRHAKASRLGPKAIEVEGEWLAALEYHGGGFFCAPNVINYSLKGQAAKARTEPKRARIFSTGIFSGLIWMPRADIYRILNCDLGSVQDWPGICAQHREPGWDTAPVVRFDADSTMQQILDCGRTVSLC